MSEKNKKWFSLNLNNNSNKTSTSCGCGKTSGGCKTHNQEEIDENVFFNDAVDASVGEQRPKDGIDQVFDVKMDRRTAFKKLTASLLIGAGAVSTSCSTLASDESKEKAQIDWEEQFKGNYKLMSNEEKEATVTRLVR